MRISDWSSDVCSSDLLHRYYRQLARYACAFALLADVSMALLGGSLKRRERLSARLGDILSQMYLASAVLKRFEDDGRQAADAPLAHWSLPRSEERRVGKECVSTCRSRGCPYHLKQKKVDYKK